ncbi:MAG: carbohydrate ABC transporter permease [Actinomycetota bacterium]
MSTASSTTVGVGGGQSKTVGARFGRSTAWLILGVIILISVFPFYWATRTGLTKNSALLAGDSGLIPDEPTILNFKRVLGLASDEEILEATGQAATGSFDYVLALRNSVIIATLVTAGQVLFCSMAAYAFARLRFKGRDQLFFLYLTGLMVPPIFILIPNLILIKNLGWLNSFPGMVAPFFLMTPFAVFFLRQFFLGINRSLEEAALIDGASHFTIYRKIILPIATPQLVTLAVLTYVTSWNEFLWPLVVAPVDENVQPLTVALGSFAAQNPGSAPDWSGLMTGTILAALPMLLIFFVFGKRLVDSIQFSGIK